MQLNTSGGEKSSVTFITKHLSSHLSPPSSAWPSNTTTSPLSVVSPQSIYSNSSLPSTTKASPTWLSLQDSLFLQSQNHFNTNCSELDPLFFLPSSLPSTLSFPISLTELITLLSLSDPWTSSLPNPRASTQSSYSSTVAASDLSMKARLPVICKNLIES